MLDGIKLRELRQRARDISEILVRAQSPTSLSYTADYFVEEDANDRLSTVWNIACLDERPARVFFSEDWNTGAVEGPEKWECRSEVADTTVIVLHTVDEPDKQELAIYLDPPVGADPRRVSIAGTWPNMWKGLREARRDYIEIETRRGLVKATVLVHIPRALGDFEWGPRPSRNVSVRRTENADKQTLELVVKDPAEGQSYRVEILPIVRSPDDPGAR